MKVTLVSKNKPGQFNPENYLSIKLKGRNFNNTIAKDL
jgi:hypothetical protein